MTVPTQRSLLPSLAFQHFTQRHGLLLRPDAIDFLQQRLPNLSPETDDADEGGVGEEQLSQLVEFIATSYAGAKKAKASSISQDLSPTPDTYVDRKALEAVVDQIFHTSLALRNPHAAALDPRSYVRPLSISDFSPMSDSKRSALIERDGSNWWRWRHRDLARRCRLVESTRSILTLCTDDVDARVRIFGLLQRLPSGALIMEDLTGSVELMGVKGSIAPGMFAVCEGWVRADERATMAKEVLLEVSSLALPRPTFSPAPDHPSPASLFVETREQLLEIEECFPDECILFLTDLDACTRLADKWPEIKPIAVFAVGTEAHMQRAQIANLLRRLPRPPLLFSVCNNERLPAFPQPPLDAGSETNLPGVSLMNPARVLFGTQEIVVVDVPNAALALCANARSSGEEVDFEAAKRSLFEVALSQASLTALAPSVYQHVDAVAYLGLAALPNVLLVSQRASPSMSVAFDGGHHGIMQSCHAKPVLYAYYPTGKCIREIHL